LSRIEPKAALSPVENFIAQNVAQIKRLLQSLKTTTSSVLHHLGYVYMTTFYVF